MVFVSVPPSAPVGVPRRRRGRASGTEGTVLQRRVYSNAVGAGVGALEAEAEARRRDEALEAWARERSVEFDDAVRVARFEGGLRGMMANRDHITGDGGTSTSSDAWVVRVPQPCALEVTSLSSSLPFPEEENFAGVTRDYWRAAPWFVKLALMLLYGTVHTGKIHACTLEL